MTRDGLSKHFFHRPSKAYTTGTRKRRKIQTDGDQQGGGGGSSSGAGETRWHKTGKTRPVMVNGRQKGCKKILVLYTNFGKNRKPEKTNWVMHQYHLGQNEEEKEGELVVSKIFYQTQPRQSNVNSWGDRGGGAGGGGGGGAAGVVAEGRAGSGDHQNPSRRDNHSTGSGSCSSREVMINDHQTSAGAAAAAAVNAVAAMPSFGAAAIDVQHQLRGTADHQFGFASSYRKGFDHDTHHQVHIYILNYQNMFMLMLCVLIHILTDMMIESLEFLSGLEL